MNPFLCERLPQNCKGIYGSRTQWTRLEFVHHRRRHRRRTTDRKLIRLLLGIHKVRGQLYGAARRAARAVTLTKVRDAPVEVDSGNGIIPFCWAGGKYFPFVRWTLWIWDCCCCCCEMRGNFSVLIERFKELVESLSVPVGDCCKWL